MRKRTDGTRPDDGLTPAVSETLRLYNAWLAVLLKKLGTAEVRVGASELRDALKGLSCTVSREGETYVIRPGGADASDTRAETGKEDV